MESATRLGVELDEHEAAEWVAAMETEASGGDLVVDVDTGVYGHRVTMLDFQPEDLARFREMATIVGFEDRPPQVMTALSISGSAAQSKINAYPADCDFFERVHIQADTREEACAILADLMREKALATAVGPTHRLWEVKFGSHPVAATKGGSPVGAGSPMSWTLEEVKAGQMEVTLPDGALRVVHVGGRVARPGLVQARLGHRRHDARPAGQREQRARPDLGGARRHDRAARRLPRPVLPGGLPRAESIPLFSKLVKELSADSVDDYVDTLEHEVWKYTVKEPNYGKAARRMYNVFRLNGQLPRGGLHPRAVRRAGDRAVPGRRADPDARRRRVVGRHVRHRDDGRAGRRADHVGDPGARRPGGGRDGRPPAAAPQLAPGARDARPTGPTRWPASRTPRSSAVNDYFERALRSVPEIDAYLEDVARRAP